MGRVLVCGETQKKPPRKMVLRLAVEECTTASQLKRAARGPVVTLLCVDVKRTIEILLKQLHVNV